MTPWTAKSIVTCVAGHHRLPGGDLRLRGEKGAGVSRTLAPAVVPAAAGLDRAPACSPASTHTSSSHAPARSMQRFRGSLSHGNYQVEVDVNTRIKPVRSFLFVPGNKESMLDKAAQAGADALILDLEDSVPSPEKPRRVNWSPRRFRSSLRRISESGCASTVLHISMISTTSWRWRQPASRAYISPSRGGPEDVYMASCMIAEAERAPTCRWDRSGSFPCWKPRGPCSCATT